MSGKPFGDAVCVSLDHFTTISSHGPCISGMGLVIIEKMERYYPWRSCVWGVIYLEVMCLGGHKFGGVMCLEVMW